MKSGNLEDKLKFAFMVYDNDHNGYIDKQEMSQLISTSALARGLTLSPNELQMKVGEVFQKADLNQDGVLNYDEFKNAVINSQILLNPFWINSKILPVFQKQYLF